MPGGDHRGQIEAREDRRSDLLRQRRRAILGDQSKSAQRTTMRATGREGRTVSRGTGARTSLRRKSAPRASASWPSARRAPAVRSAISRSQRNTASERVRRATSLRTDKRPQAKRSGDTASRGADPRAGDPCPADDRLPSQRLKRTRRMSIIRPAPPACLWPRPDTDPSIASTRSVGFRPAKAAEDTRGFDASAKRTLLTRTKSLDS